ncbi:galactose-6-phosphate isomerase subunit LacA [Melissococcus plutonius]|uniref:Galactose-6-phosphate isomerase subunit LacA n=2 Tax=Melissococcus plutonius TaxID=33970 RepID=F3Y8M2_MELPT|nr:galactose-6-phosphate isomerase subunit LacA [Melissococcus plutonius]BAL62731.1 galactose-6-phosphate isomerase, LacA subunit [Melissococcus plutonius DAT561]AIM24532.1 galactose-6-phosphate isomerase subunit LacA [Melissococcus plutonius S1]KMT24592.1 galactose-6-phosphate isomerase subunit LacA [Melissococcus plutonius]KMT27305.1 galactose-6-phosphate isomerase subunit LacA [Melissococcus plutonius]KMT27478.1 galactose-6-phosphate isomerase subunit LacA [Melissococcus plutonius]
MKRVVIGADTEGMMLKNYIKQYLIENGFELIDKSEEPSEDFVESTVKIAQEVLANQESLGIAFDGYGAGSFMVATKIKGMIAAEVSDERSAYMTREHNNARMITIGEKIVGEELAKNIVKEFLRADYAGGRHQIRVDMLNKMA